MAEILPLPWLYEISSFNISMGTSHDMTVKTRVVDRVAILNCGITELRSLLKSSNIPFVGIDIVNGGDLLLLCVKNHCLVIQFRRMMALDAQTKIPYSLLQLLSDKNVTFVGPKDISQSSTSISSGDSIKLECNRITDITYLAAKILKKPMLLTSTLEELEFEVGIDIKKPITSYKGGDMRTNWHSSPVLSDEEVKFAMYKAYSCYHITGKLSDIKGAGCIINSSSSDLYESTTCYVYMGGGVSVTTRVVDSLALLKLGISELTGELKYPNPFVGIDIVNGGDLLLLYVKKLCLVIQFRRLAALDDLTDQVPNCLLALLCDKSITFIGPRNDNSVISYVKEGSSNIECDCSRVVDIGYLAAKILRKPNLLTATLEELLVETGIDMKRPIIANDSIRPNWQSSSVLSEQELKFAMYAVHSCYQIAAKLTDAFGASTRVQ